MGLGMTEYSSRTFVPAPYHTLMRVGPRFRPFLASCRYLASKPGLPGQALPLLISGRPPQSGVCPYLRYLTLPTLPYLTYPVDITQPHSIQ